MAFFATLYIAWNYDVLCNLIKTRFSLSVRKSLTEDLNKSTKELLLVESVEYQLNALTNEKKYDTRTHKRLSDRSTTPFVYCLDGDCLYGMLVSLCVNYTDNN